MRNNGTGECPGVGDGGSMNEDRMTPEALAEIEVLAAAATEGPWKLVEAKGYCDAEKCPLGKDYEDAECEKCDDWSWTQGAFVDEVLTINCGEYDGMNDADARFIAASRLAVPQMAAEIRRAWALIQKIYEVADEERFLEVTAVIDAENGGTHE